MTTPPVRVKGLVKTFYDEARGEIRAVDGLDFECQKGEIFGLLGANGAGKTTTLRMLSTVLRPTSGTAEIMGFSVDDASLDVRRSLGFYSASTALYPRLTARETLDLFARINQFSGSTIKARVDFLIDRFGIEEYADARIEKLSSGMKQKVSIARTVAHDPPVLIFDEPTVGLDVLNAQELQKIISELRSDGKSILFSTHIMSEAERLCDRIAIIHKGRIHACDSLAGLRASTGEHYLEDIFVKLVGQAEVSADSGNDTA